MNDEPRVILTSAQVAHGCMHPEDAAKLWTLVYDLASTIKSHGEHPHDCRYMERSSAYSKDYTRVPPEEDECDCWIGRVLVAVEAFQAEYRMRIWTSFQALVDDIRSGRGPDVSSELLALAEDVASTPNGLNDETAEEWAQRLASGTIDGEE